MPSPNPRNCSEIVRTVAIGITILTLTGCGTFQLASGVIPLTSKTQEQQQLDNLQCKDQAKLEANTTARQTGAFLLGMTIVGAPVAFEIEKAKQREVFKSCMEAKGYRILPPNDGPNTATAQPEPAAKPIVPAPQPVATKPAVAPAPSTPAAAAPPSPGAGRDEAAQLQKLKELRDKGLITAEEHEKKRKEILDRL
jgi:hypothetical protein